MKKCLLSAGLLLTISASFGQSRRPVLIGIDVLKPIVSLVTPNRPAFRLMEAALKLPLPNQRFLSIVGGYGQFNSDVMYRNVFMNAQGPYLKIGSEIFIERNVVLGWHGLAALSHESATYFFNGPVFGDYTALAFDRRRVAVGGEGFVSYQRILSRRWVIRGTGRVILAGLLGPRNDQLPIRFVPGIGLAAGDPAVYSVGFGVHLFYRTNPNPSVNVPK